MNNLLEIQNLKVTFPTDEGEVFAVRGVSFGIQVGESLALVGESGCGKSVTALSTLRLVGERARVVADQMDLKGCDLLALSDDEIRKIRGGEIGMIFQEPMTSLNPVFRVGDQIAEVVRLHQGLDQKAALIEAVASLDRVGIASPERRVRQYPHELSGGMKQRVMIAMALSCHPALLIADEPTTALDVTIQAQILELLSKLRIDLGMAILLITHDLGVVAQFAERVLVMYAGEIVEGCDVKTLFRKPAHPYTRALLAALPRRGESGRLNAIGGNVPSPLNYGPGCAFAERCEAALARCTTERPPSIDIGGTHHVRCWLYGDRP